MIRLPVVPVIVVMPPAFDAYGIANDKAFVKLMKWMSPSRLIIGLGSGSTTTTFGLPSAGESLKRNSSDLNVRLIRRI